MGHSVMMIRPAHHGSEDWLCVERSCAHRAQWAARGPRRRHSWAVALDTSALAARPVSGSSARWRSSTRSPCVAFRPCQFLARNGWVPRIAVLQRSVHESRGLKSAAGARRRGHSEVEVFPRCCPPLSATTPRRGRSASPRRRTSCPASGPGMRRWSARPCPGCGREPVGRGDEGG